MGASDRRNHQRQPNLGAVRLHRATGQLDQEDPDPRRAGSSGLGTITEANLVGALAGQPLSALIDEIRSGNTYVNVHTSQFPGGEIRGQIQMNGR